jgi:hypothetical protein
VVVVGFFYRIYSFECEDEIATLLRNVWILVEKLLLCPFCDIFSCDMFPCDICCSESDLQDTQSDVNELVTDVKGMLTWGPSENMCAKPQRPCGILYMKAGSCIQTIK